MAADHLFELDADSLRSPPSSRAIPTTSPPPCTAASSICADGEATRFERPTGLEAVSWCPHEPVRTRRARRAAAQVPIADAVFNAAHGALLVLGLARGDWDLVARGLDDRLHQPRREHLYPRSMELVRRRARARRAGATISGAGPTVLVWTHYEPTGGVVEALWREAEGWAHVHARARSSPRGRTCASSD